MYQDGNVFASVNQYGGVDYAPHNAGVTPVFFIESIIHPAESEKAGRAIYVDMERVILHIAGDQYSAAAMPVDATIIGRFQEAYDKWKSKGQRHITGTPLEKWPLATPSFIREMEFFNIFSVDALASVADVNLDKIQDGRQWRDKAAAWLASAKDGAVATQYAAENHRLRERLDILTDQVAKLAGEKTPVLEERQRKIGKGWTPERRKQHSDTIRAKLAAKKQKLEERP